jgi:hypothetical protein
LIVPVREKVVITKPKLVSEISCVGPGLDTSQRIHPG